MGIYEGHAFLILDIKTVTHNYTCGDCQARFTKPCDLVSSRKPFAPAGRPKSTARSNASAPLHQPTSEPSVLPTVVVSSATNGSSGKQSSRVFTFTMLDVAMGVSDTSSTFLLMVITPRPTLSSSTMVVFGTVASSATRSHRATGGDLDGQGQGNHPEGCLWARFATDPASPRRWLHSGGEVEFEAPAPWANTRCPEKQTETYPHAIVYDFESYQDKTKAACPTRDLSYESEHVPISVSIADTLNP